jgi:hypothetical protein
MVVRTEPHARHGKQVPNKKGPIQQKLDYGGPPIYGDVCGNCCDVVEEICALCRRCPGCGHVQGCPGEFVKMED